MKLTSPMGRKVVPLLVAFGLGVVVATVALEAKAWSYWQGEAEARVVDAEGFFTEWALGIQRHAAQVALTRHEADMKPVVVKPTVKNPAEPTRKQMVELQKMVNVPQ